MYRALQCGCKEEGQVCMVMLLLILFCLVSTRLNNNDNAQQHKVFILFWNNDPVLGDTSCISFFGWLFTCELLNKKKKKRKHLSANKRHNER